MTLIVALVNRDQTLQVSDRRLSYFSARPPDDESDKAIYYKTGNGRFAVGYTGLAAAGSFRTHPWLVEQLGEVSEPEYLAGVALQRLRDRLDHVFKEKRVLRNLSRAQRRLTVVFSGFLEAGGTVRGANAVLSNFQDPQSGLDAGEAKDEFHLDLVADDGVTHEAFTLVRAFGAQGAITADELAGLEGCSKLVARSTPSRPGRSLSFALPRPDRRLGAPWESRCRRSHCRSTPTARLWPFMPRPQTG
jgi:hypothetical protein